MAGFFNPLDIRDNDDGTWVILHDFDYDIGELGGEKIIVKSGFPTDFASTPRFLWRIFPPYDPLYRKPAVIHDWLYAKQDYDKAIADAIFLEAMKVRGVGYFRRYCVYWGVHAFGSKAWNEHMRKKKIASELGQSYPKLVEIIDIKELKK